jgi:hypothetical protein
MMTIVFCPYEDKPNPNGTDYGPLWFEEVPIPPLYVQQNLERSIWFYSGNFLLTIYYSVAIVYGALTIQNLTKKFSMIVYNKKAKSTQRQLTRTMAVQVNFHAEHDN